MCKAVYMDMSVSLYVCIHGSVCVPVCWAPFSLPRPMHIFVDLWYNHLFREHINNVSFKCWKSKGEQHLSSHLVLSMLIMAVWAIVWAVHVQISYFFIWPGLRRNFIFTMGIQNISVLLQCLMTWFAHLAAEHTSGSLVVLELTIIEHLKTTINVIFYVGY